MPTAMTTALSRPLSSPELSSAAARRLHDLIATRQASVAVMGLGYVGLPLAVESGKAGFSVTAFDTDATKIALLNRGQSYVSDVDSSELEDLVERGRLRATSDEEALQSADIVLICVPTPLRKTRDPDLSYVVAAAEALSRRIRPGMLAILESTTYPGTTQELILPTLERGGLTAGVDFFLCYSPERVDPGNVQHRTQDIPKVVGGLTPVCTQMGVDFYSSIVEQVTAVSTPTTAEMVKLLENTFRMINIGLVNEMAIMCRRMDIDVWEVIEAAATKPFGFMPFYPGPGLGGHCIPIDPHYLSWKIRQTGYEPRFIQLASEINRSMPEYVVRRVQSALNDNGRSVRGAKIHVVGVAYKRDVSDVRESPALDILDMLHELGAELSYSDEHVPALETHRISLRSGPPAQAAEADCAVIVTDHSSFDYRWLAENARLIFDARNALRNIPGDNIVRL